MTERAVIIDTETTGLEAPEAVEVALIELTDPGSLIIATEFVARFRPSKPITLGALATHHIMDEDLVDCPPSSSFKLPAGTDYLIGHNVDYDWEAIGKPDVKRIDTVCLARKLWPDVDSHGLGAMIYHLRRSQARGMLKGAHSAATDASNCRLLLRAILGRLGNPPTWAEVWEASERARVPEIWTFGKHKGELIKDSPRDYKDWMLRQPDVDPYLRKALTA